MNNFKYGGRSKGHLKKLEPRMVDVCELALSYSRVDISAVETLRELEQQKKNVANGVSWTLDSKHLANENGLSEAVDLYPWVDGETNHAIEHYREIAKAMFRAAIELGVQIRWGGLWGQADCPHWERG